VTIAPTHVDSLSAVVPVYESAESLSELAARLEPVLRACADQFELVLVNDGSCDASWATIAELERQHSWIPSSSDSIRGFAASI
jgi:glycosyltransferase involved in cell wall biosynthesis